MIRILFVCMGNLCRSPMAEALMAHHVATLGLQSQIAVSSAGTSSRHRGEPIDPRAQKVLAARLGTQLKRFQSRGVTNELLDTHDLVLAMDQQVLSALAERCHDNQRRKLHLLRTYAGCGAPAEIPDPYFGNLTGFERVMDLLEECNDQVLQRALALRA